MATLSFKSIVKTYIKSNQNNMFITQAIKLLTEAPLLTTYQSFIRPHLDQRDFLM